MQPCESCASCSFQERVTLAKQQLPNEWLQELADLDANDTLYVATLAEFDNLNLHGEEIPFNFSDTKVASEYF